MTFRSFRAFRTRSLAAAIVLIAGVMGCGSDPTKLTRDRAAKLVKQNLSGTMPVLRTTTGTMPEATLPNEDRAMIVLRLATATAKADQFGNRETTVTLTAHARQLAQAQKWHQDALVLGITAWEIPIGTYQLSSVTGIQRADKTHAFVTFEYRAIPNDIGKQLLGTGHANVIHVVSPLANIPQANPMTQAQQAENNALAVAQMMGVNTNPTADVVLDKSATATIPFTLYDDGWRVGQ